MGRSRICYKKYKSVLYCNSNVSPIELQVVENKNQYTKIITRTTSCLSFKNFKNLREVKIWRHQSSFKDLENCFCLGQPGQ